jgi:alpha-glucosidase
VPRVAWSGGPLISQAEWWRDTPPPLVAFRRRNGQESLLIVLNTAAEPASVPAELIAPARPLDGHGFLSSRGDGGLVLPRYGMFFGAEQGID